MTVNNLIEQLSYYNDSIKDKEICVLAPNKMLLAPTVKLQRKDEFGSYNIENIKCVVISWD